jgi:hypothetical protein
MIKLTKAQVADDLEVSRQTVYTMFGFDDFTLDAAIGVYDDVAKKILLDAADMNARAMRIRHKRDALISRQKAEGVQLCPNCGDDRTGKGSLIADGKSYCNENCYKEAHNG